MAALQKSLCRSETESEIFRIEPGGAVSKSECLFAAAEAEEGFRFVEEGNSFLRILDGPEGKKIFGLFILAGVLVIHGANAQRFTVGEIALIHEADGNL